MQIPTRTNLLVGVTGSISAYRTCDVVSALVKEGYEVRCVMTVAATKFVSPLTFETLSHQPVFVDAFGYNPFSKSLHIALAEWAQLVLVMPATANIMAKIRYGMADDLLASVILSTQAPLLIVPAMNTQMWDHPATQENVKVLRQRQVEFIEPVFGELSCGTVGVGHIAEKQTVLETIHRFFKRSPEK